MKLLRQASVSPGALGVAALGTADVDAQEVYQLNLANAYAESSLPGQTDQRFIELVEEKTDGEVKITGHWGGGLGYDSRDHYSAVRDGAVALASTPFDKLVGFEPVYALQSLPFLTPTIETTEALFHVARPYYEEAFNQANQTLLLGEPWTPQGIWAKQKIDEISDLEGLKIRTYDVTGTKTLKAAGASPIQLAWGDVVPALSTNTITAVLTSDEGGVNSRFWELGAKYFNFLGYTMGINAVTMNLDAFNRLPEKHRKAIREAAAEAEKAGWEIARSRVESNRQTMEENGAIYVDDVPQEVIDHLKEAGAPLLDEWKEEMGPAADEILAEFREKTS